MVGKTRQKSTYWVHKHVFDNKVACFNSFKIDSFYVTRHSPPDIISNTLLNKKKMQKLNKRPMGHIAHLRKILFSKSFYKLAIIYPCIRAWLIIWRKKMNFLYTFECFMPSLVKTGNEVLKLQYLNILYIFYHFDIFSA